MGGIYPGLTKSRHESCLEASAEDEKGPALRRPLSQVRTECGSARARGRRRDRAEERDRMPRVVVDGDEDGETPSTDAADLHSLRPRGLVAPQAAPRAVLDTGASGEWTLCACSAAADHCQDDRRRKNQQGVQVLRHWHTRSYVAVCCLVTEE